MYYFRYYQAKRAITDFINNPQLFIERCIDIIKDTRHELAIDGIKYIKLDGEQYYVQEIFDSEELMATLDKNAVAVKNSVYDYIIYDSDTVEKPFAKALDDDTDVKMFFKLPQNFKIRTPIGNYNPDLAVYLDKDGTEGLTLSLKQKAAAQAYLTSVQRSSLKSIAAKSILRRWVRIYHYRSQKIGANLRKIFNI